MMDILKKYWKYLLGLAIVLALLFFAWQLFSPKPQPVTFETQEQAQSSEGIKQAADNAHVDLSDHHAGDIAGVVAKAAQHEPDKVVETIGKELAATAETERIKAGADFSVIAPASSGVKEGESAALPAIEPEQPVILNQYNIRAYPSHQWSGTYYSNKAFDLSWQMRIGKSGTYIGPAVLCNDGRIVYGIRVTGTN